jgi:hypothetical protein
MKSTSSNLALGLFLLMAYSGTHAADQVLKNNPVTPNNFAHDATRFGLDWNGLHYLAEKSGRRAYLDDETGLFRWVSPDGTLLSTTIDAKKMFRGEPSPFVNVISYSAKYISHKYYTYKEVWMTRDPSVRNLPHLKHKFSQIEFPEYDLDWVLIVYKVGDFPDDIETTGYGFLEDHPYIADVAIFDREDGSYWVDPSKSGGIGHVAKEDWDIIKAIEGWPKSWQ